MGRHTFHLSKMVPDSISVPEHPRAAVTGVGCILDCHPPPVKDGRSGLYIPNPASVATKQQKAAG